MTTSSSRDGYWAWAAVVTVGSLCWSGCGGQPREWPERPKTVRAQKIAGIPKRRLAAEPSTSPLTPKVGAATQAKPSTRAKLSARATKRVRMVDGDEFALFRLRHRRKVKHYARLATQNHLSQQILFQLYRDERLRTARQTRKKAAAARATALQANLSNARVTTLRAERSTALGTRSELEASELKASEFKASNLRARAVPATAGPRGFVRRSRSLRRQAYGTSFFAALKATPAQAIADIGEALSRPQVSRPERVELLRLLHALVRKGSAPEIRSKARDVFLAYALRAFNPADEDYTPHLAFAYYARLETEAAERINNGARFARRPHAPIPPNLARRMYRSRVARTAAPRPRASQLDRQSLLLKAGGAS